MKQHYLLKRFISIILFVLLLIGFSSTVASCTKPNSNQPTKIDDKEDESEKPDKDQTDPNREEKEIDKNLKYLKTNHNQDVIYQIITDRFFDGDKKNNPKGNIYNPNHNRYYHGGDWQGIIQKIKDGYLTDLGVGALWISPPVKNVDGIYPNDERIGHASASYHGYWAEDFFKTNPYFGTFDDFRELIKVANEHNMKIYIDFAPNHTSPAVDYDKDLHTVDHNLYPEQYRGRNDLKPGGELLPNDGALYRDGKLLGKLHDSKDHNLFNKEGWTNFSSWENSVYNTMFGLADLNHLNPVVDNYFKDAIKKWLDLGIAGIRLDAVRHMPIGWQRNFTQYINSYKPSLLFGEWFAGSNVVDNELKTFANNSGMSLLDFNLTHAIRNSLGSYSEGMQHIHSTLEDTSNNFEHIHNQVTFIDNHDMPRFMEISNKKTNRVDLALATLLTMRGIPAVYYGTEQYMDGKEDPENRKSMTSFNRSTRAYQIIKKLSKLRKDNPAIQFGDYKERWLDNDVLVYERTFNQNTVVIMINRSESASYELNGLQLGLPKGTYDDYLNNLLNGFPITVQDNGKVEHYRLNPNTFQVFVSNKQNSNVVLGNVNTLQAIQNDRVILSGDNLDKIKHLYISDNKGNNNIAKLELINNNNKLAYIEIPNINSGMYQIKALTKEDKWTNSINNLKILTNKQVTARIMLKLDKMQTIPGETVHINGNIFELANNSERIPIHPLFNSTKSIAIYPNHFIDVSLPIDTKFKLGFMIKNKDGSIKNQITLENEYIITQEMYNENLKNSTNIVIQTQW